MPTASGVLVSQATSLQVAAVFACVRIRARDLARCTPQILSDDGTGNKSIITNHPLAALFRKPNRVQPWFNFAEQLHVSLMLRSNAYAVILRDWRGTPTELIPLNPDLVTVMESPDGSIFYNVSRAGLWLMAVLEDEPVVIPAEDVLHVRDLTFNTLVGVSRIALARDAIGLAMVQEQQASRWAGNGARPAGVLQSAKQISLEAAKRLRQQWDELQSGLQNTGRTAILEDGLEWKQMALTSVDLEFGAARLYQVKEVARFFEVPLHKLGENESLPRASIAELNADYVQNTVIGDATRWEQAFEQHFGITGNLAVKLDEKALLRADLATMTNAARTGVMSGLITQNEGRAIIGYGPMADADKLLAPVNLAPNGSAIDGTAPDGAGRPPTGNNPGDMKALSAQDVDRLADAVVKRLKTFNPDQPRDANGRWSGGSSADFHKLHSDLVAASERNLSKPEIEAASFYALHGDELNRDLRKGARVSQNDEAHIVQLAKAVRKSKLADTTVLFRGISSSVVDKAPLMTAPGTIVQDVAFTSTSLSSAVAKKYSPGGYVLSISAPKGSSVLPIPDDSEVKVNEAGEYEGNFEMLLAQNAPVRILYTDKNTKTIHAELL